MTTDVPKQYGHRIRLDKPLSFIDLSAKEITCIKQLKLTRDCRDQFNKIAKVNLRYLKKYQNYKTEESDDMYKYHKEFINFFGMKPHEETMH